MERDACIPGAYCPEVNRLGREVNHSPPPRTYLQWSLSVSEEHSTRVLEQRDQDLKHRK
jgi:hypothetical protein